MSNSSAVADSGNRNNNSFSQTVNRFSQYIKEKRARGATMNLFPLDEKLAPVEDLNGGRTINLFPQLSSPKSVAAPLIANSCVNKPGSPEPSAAQMTIFYGGNVIVFNDLSSDKAKEVMDLATNLELSVKKRKLETSVPATTVNFRQNLNPLTLVPTVGDMPMTRKASIHRFLEKRRDRLVAKAPSSSDLPSGGSSKPNIEGNSWLGLGPLPIFQENKFIHL